jgi:hypothetical protein
VFGRKTIKRSASDLKAKFETLGVDQVDFSVSDELDPQSNPRLAPLVLFHEVWKGALRKGDTEWLQASIEHFENRKNLSGVAAAMWPEEDDFLQALLAVRDSGIDLKLITTIARRAQEHLLHHVAYTLSDPSSDEELFKDVTWAVFETDENDKPIRQMNCLHEYYGLVDPDRGDG